MNSLEEKESGYIIKKIIVPHCQRGPQRCEKCKQMAAEKKICLLQIYFKSGEIARPVIEVNKDGKTQWYEFDVLKVFKDEKEAKTYAKKHAIKVQFPLD